MKLNNITANLDEDEITNILVRAIEAQTGLTVESVSFKIGTRSVGYGMDEHDETYFEGVTVSFGNTDGIKGSKNG